MTVSKKQGFSLELNRVTSIPNFIQIRPVIRGSEIKSVGQIGGQTETESPV